MKKSQGGANGSNNRNTAGRIAALLVLVLIALAVDAYLRIYRQPQGLAPGGNDSRYSLLDPVRKFYKKEDIIVNFQPLRDDLNKIGENPHISIYFEYLNSGANIGVNKDADFYPASLLKLPVAMAAVKKIEKGDWKWENELVLMGSDKDSRFGELYKQPIGTTFAIRELVRQMLAESDDTAYNIILRNLEPDELGDIHKHLGLEDFLTKGEKISAKQYAVILRSLYTAAYLNEEYSEELLKMMVNLEYRDYLGSAISQDVKFAHKIGISGQNGVFLDAGIVYVPHRAYILIAMVETKSEEEAKKIMREISEKAYNYTVNYKNLF